MKPARIIVALAVFAVPAAVYIASASWEPASWDTAELQGVPYILGIAHPTGFPFYVILGYAWSHVIALESVAWRMNALSAMAMSGCALAAYGVALQFGASLPVALFAALWFAVSPNIWAHAVRAEAQDLAVLCAAIALYAFVRWLRGAADYWFVIAFALCGLAIAAHPNALWIFPALLLGSVIAPRRPTRRLVAASVALFVGALMIYLYLPLRSAYIVAHHLDPVAALAGAGGGLFWNYDDPHTMHGLALELSGSEFDTPAYFLASFNPVHVLAALATFAATLRQQYDTSALLLILGGLVCALRRDWRATTVVCTGCIAGLVFSAIYPNESDVGRYRLLVSWLAVPLLGALTPQSRSRLGLFLHALLLAYLAAGASIAFERQRSFFHRPPGEGGRWVIAAVRPYVPAGSVIVTGWLDATSLAYGAYVDGSLAGRIIVSDDRLDANLYRIWARDRCVFVLVNPRDVAALNGAIDYAMLDPYHELYKVRY